MASATFQDNEVYDLLDLSDSEVSDWIPDSDEELSRSEDEDETQDSSQLEPDNSLQRCVFYLDLAVLPIFRIFAEIRNFCSPWKFLYLVLQLQEKNP